MGSGNLDAAPSTEQILKETQRRLEERQRPPQPLEIEESRWARGANHTVFWLSKHWLALFNTLIGLYIGGAFLAPLLLRLGHESAASLLYRFYSPFCHQYPFRSWFLFGPQAAYPAQRLLQMDEMSRLYHQIVGNASIGYKVGLCQRDVAIYGGMVLIGLLYGLVRKRLAIRPLPILAFVILGMLPMLLDGGLQWLSYAVWWLLKPAWLLPHETTPFFRTLTGALFGIGLVWVGYPSINEFFEETRETLNARYGWK